MNHKYRPEPEEPQDDFTLVRFDPDAWNGPNPPEEITEAEASAQAEVLGKRLEDLPLALDDRAMGGTIMLEVTGDSPRVAAVRGMFESILRLIVTPWA